MKRMVAGNTRLQ